MNTCADCYWYSDITVHVCELEKEPTSADQEACPMFEQKRLDWLKKEVKE